MENDGELFGAAINLAARVMDRADGGEVLVTEAVRQVAGTMPGARFRDRGRVALKGFPERQHLLEVRQAEGCPSAAAAAPRSRRLIASRGALARRGPVGAARAPGGAETVEVSPNSVAILDPDDGRVVEEVPVGVRPGDVGGGRGSVWVANLGDDTLTDRRPARRVPGSVSAGIASTARGRPERRPGR